MLTPVEMQGRELRTGRGYQKKEADDFLAEIYRDYETLYREHMELKDKVKTLSDGLNYYKDLEKTLQKTLVVAERTAEETTKVAEKKAALILSDSQTKASQIVHEANMYFEKAQGSIKLLMQQYENYRIQCKKLADANLELLNSEAFKVDFEMVGLTLPAFAIPTYATMTAASEIILSEETNEKFLGETTKKTEAGLETVDLSGETSQADEPDRSAARKQAGKESARELDTELFEFFNLGDEE